MNTGVPPTDPKARTGEFTPPGKTAQARSYQLADDWSLGKSAVMN